MRESKSERRQQIQRQGMAYRRHTHSLGCCPPASWQATRKALTPALSHGRGSRWSPRHSLPHKPHSITHQKQPAPHSCAESEKAACTFKKPSAGCFLMCFRRPSSFPRKRGKSECYRQPAPRAATRKRGYGGDTPCRLSGCGDGRCRLLLRLHACRSNHATASMCAVCGNRLSMPAARKA